MIKYLKYRFQLNRLFRERELINKKLATPVLGEEYIPIQIEHDEIEIVEHKIYRLTSDYYWEKAFRLGVPVPSNPDYWQASKAYPGTDHLNREGLRALKSEFRESRKQALELFSVLMAGLTGLVGTATGLFAVISP